VDCGSAAGSADDTPLVGLGANTEGNIDGSKRANHRVVYCLDRVPGKGRRVAGILLWNFVLLPLGQVLNAATAFESLARGSAACIIVVNSALLLFLTYLCDQTARLSTTPAGWLIGWEYMETAPGRVRAPVSYGTALLIVSSESLPALLLWGDGQGQAGGNMAMSISVPLWTWLRLVVAAAFLWASVARMWHDPHGRTHGEQWLMVKAVLPDPEERPIAQGPPVEPVPEDAPRRPRPMPVAAWLIAWQTQPLRDVCLSESSAGGTPRGSPGPSSPVPTASHNIDQTHTVGVDTHSQGSPGMGGDDAEEISSGGDNTDQVSQDCFHAHADHQLQADLAGEPGAVPPPRAARSAPPRCTWWPAGHG